MGFAVKLADASVFLLSLVIALSVPIIDGQTCLPLSLYPESFVDLKNWYSREYGDYLFSEKPDFFVGLVWLEILFQWPLALSNIYGILAGKPWIKTTSLIFGVSVTTSMVAILSDMIRSKKASDTLLMIYYPFLGLSVLAILRGLLPHSSRTTSNIGKRPAALGRKKRT
ncbi:transmembrane protein 97-like [Quillaja saponaria]|uniref:Transmembrane protein 97-like n=1 Tax=Quillaja saponaria TaxID=32244 RepID=A0AAD7QH09_QUISA|nr:transmembrane protein 97-like [Quillaja saponaria]